ncbi:flavin reductase family protein [Micromonospora sp. SD19]|uniref:Flavin reductase family protein n=1 Tax=Micromonospora parva TaxID=1464048 RepID=A0ABW6VTY3_9ACTN
MTTVERPSAGAVELRPVNGDLFRALLRRQATSVTVVTAVARGTEPACLGGIGAPIRAGFTATSFTSVSLDPPLVSFCLGTASSSWPVVARAEHVAVHLLAAGQREAATVFATSGIDRFAAYPHWTSGPFGVPLLGGVLARLLCRVVHRVPAGDHSLVIAEPLALGDGGDGAPLVHHRGGYTTAGAPT